MIKYITHLCLNHGCSSGSQVSNKVEDIDCTFRFYPVQRAIDNHEGTCSTNSSTWKWKGKVQEISNVEK